MRRWDAFLARVRTTRVLEVRSSSLSSERMEARGDGQGLVGPGL
jgi:hypothetical protein